MGDPMGMTAFTRLVDREAGIVLYVHANGIAAVPLIDTNLTAKGR